MEDSMNNSKKVMQENLVITEKFELLKNEYNKLESEYNRISSELKAELQVRKDALQNYEDMETQLDRMINNPQNWDKMGNIISSFPTKSSVRIKHAMKIASKLNET
jgi:predicted nuclease with TOPRIM domain